MFIKSLVASLCHLFWNVISFKLKILGLFGPRVTCGTLCWTQTIICWTMSKGPIFGSYSQYLLKFVHVLFNSKYLQLIIFWLKHGPSLMIMWLLAFYIIAKSFFHVTMLNFDEVIQFWCCLWSNNPFVPHIFFMNFYFCLNWTVDLDCMCNLILTTSDLIFVDRVAGGWCTFVWYRCFWSIFITCSKGT